MFASNIAFATAALDYLFSQPLLALPYVSTKAAESMNYFYKNQTRTTYARSPFDQSSWPTRDLAGNLHASEALSVRPLVAVFERGRGCVGGGRHGDDGAVGDEAVGLDQHRLLGDVRRRGQRGRKRYQGLRKLAWDLALWLETPNTRKVIEWDWNRQAD